MRNIIMILTLLLANGLGVMIIGTQVGGLTMI